jgi:predicted ATPase/class 3 adenylate cyclase
VPGNLTFLFSDIEGSTQRWHRFGDTMAAALETHDRVMRDAIEAAGGTVFKTVGDAFCAVFTDADSGARAALAAQRALRSTDFSMVEDLRVRIALHSGPAQERATDYFGTTVNRVARLLSAAHGGQTLLSEEAATLLSRGMPNDARVSDLGSHLLKDLPEPEHIYQLCADDLELQFPPLRVARAAILPAPVTSFIARSAEAEQLETLLRDHRLVTVAGPGGMGKTRLAVHVARQLYDRHASNVWFADLAPATDRERIVAALATAVQVRLLPGDTFTSLCNALRTVQGLLILDNCEHLSAELPGLISTLLRACPHLRAVATSRQPLRVSGEVVLRLSSLTRTESMDLFIARAYAGVAAPGVAEVATIQELCDRLDGLPLALELAASRVRTLGLAQVAKLIDELPRQETMRALLDWSFELLSAGERAALVQLAAFSGGWTASAADSVCGASPQTLESLVDKSLVVLDVGSGRYDLLDTTRAYLREKLSEYTDASSLERRRAQWLAGCAEPEIEVDNLRAALTGCLVEGNDPPLGAQLLTATERIWRELEGEGIRYADAASRLLDEALHPELCGTLYRMLAVFYSGQSRIEYARRAIAAFEPHGNPVQLAASLRSLGTGLLQTGDVERAVSVTAQALEVLEQTGRKRSVPYAQALMARSTALSAKGAADAEPTLQRAIAIFESLGADEDAAAAKLNLAESLFARGDADGAIEMLGEVLESNQRTLIRANALINLAAYRLSAGETKLAATLAWEGLLRANSAGFISYVNVALQHLAAVAACAAQTDAAAQLCGYVDAWLLREGMAREATENVTYAILQQELHRRASPGRIAVMTEIGAEITHDEAIELAQRATEAVRCT